MLLRNLQGIHQVGGGGGKFNKKLCKHQLGLSPKHHMGLKMPKFKLWSSKPKGLKPSFTIQPKTKAKPEKAKPNPKTPNPISFEQSPPHPPSPPQPHTQTMAQLATYNATIVTSYRIPQEATKEPLIWPSQTAGRLVAKLPYMSHPEILEAPHEIWK